MPFDAAMPGDPPPPLPSAGPTPDHTVPPPSAPEALEPRPTRRFAAVWALTALAAAGYLALAATKPDMLADLSGVAHRAAVSATPDAAAGASREEQGLRDTISRLQAEVTRLTSNVIASEERASQLAEKLAALETPATAAVAAASEAKPTTTAAAALAGKFVDQAPAPAPAAAATEKKAGAAKPGAQVADAGRTAPARASDAATGTAAPGGLKVINQAANPGAAPGPGAGASAIETGSITPPPASAVAAPAPAPAQPPGAAAASEAPISFGAAVVTPAPRPVGVQIANGQSVDALRLSWTMLTEQNDSLRSLQPRYTNRAGADGESFDLVAGPIKTTAQAKRVCRSLEARGVGCRIANFEGNAL